MTWDYEPEGDWERLTNGKVSFRVLHPDGENLAALLNDYEMRLQPPRCELLRAREVGLPEPCGERATGWYESELGEVYRACDEHANAEVKP